MPLDDRALRNSITVAIAALDVNEFLDARLFERFVGTVASLDAAWLPDDVRLFAIEGDARAVNVSFFVATADDTIVE